MLQGAGGHEVLEAQMMSWEQQRWGLGARLGGSPVVGRCVPCSGERTNRAGCRASDKAVMKYWDTAPAYPQAGAGRSVWVPVALKLTAWRPSARLVASQLRFCGPLSPALPLPAGPSPSHGSCPWARASRLGCWACTCCSTGTGGRVQEGREGLGEQGTWCSVLTRGRTWVCSPCRN